MESCVPPGFRFHPTEEELVGYYLKRKVSALAIDLDVIIDIDLYKMEPWDIQGRCKLGYQEQTEWYFFSHKDRKYPTGTRTNRATTAGFWKATGRDKPVVSKDSIIGMRKTLVFYKGRAPNGRKSDWIMHEYRLQTSEHGPPHEEGWVVCRAFKKPVPSQKPGFDSWSNPYNIRNSYRPPSYFSNLNNNAAMPSFDPDLIQGTSFHHQQQPPLPQGTLNSTHSPLLDPPNLDSPSNVSASFVTNDSTKFEHSAGMAAIDDLENEKGSFGNQELSDWKSFDKLIGQSSYAYTNMALVPYNGELDNNGDENHLSQVLDCCFPDL